MAAGETFFVQFPHPGPEHYPGRAVVPFTMDWNTGDHRRKFLLARGRYLDPDDSAGNGELVLWGEWEAPSRIIHRWPADGYLPRALHRPYWFHPTGGGFRQNTDPWVWGERMLYSNCKQTTPAGGRAAVQGLTRGSVICFGSAIGGEFCVDTVFVVASAEHWTPADDTIASQAEEAFWVCTAQAIASGEDRYARAEFTLYQGATIDNRVNGMYSFVPAMPASGGYPRFARPSVELPGLINPASTQSAYGARRSLTADTVRDAWEKIRHQVLEPRHGPELVLAVHLDTPPRHPTHAGPPATTRSRC